MITSIGFNNVLNYISGLISKGRYVLDGNNVDVPILSKNIDGSTLTVNIFLADGTGGAVTDIKLIGTDGQVFADKPDTIEKLAAQGVLVIFKFTITEV
ncbi:hypothetical protein [Clostridium sp. AWRP]|uniref:hypothetical protein n=1 Tax=Clostridium sp. AWRP TaxID=2212991 RepID=UPI000FDC742E|nr:hypothetical protein [Clostridium sp. AWRP]AZV57914.1 hypothetical protein DMR38_15590 [Clostridium sp. AWRP]